MLPRGKGWWRSRTAEPDPALAAYAAGPSDGQPDPAGHNGAEAPPRPVPSGNTRRPRASSPDAAANPGVPLTLTPEDMAVPPPARSVRVLRPLSSDPMDDGVRRPAAAAMSSDPSAPPRPPAEATYATDATAEWGAPPQPMLTGESAPDLYLDHFGLRARPFSLVPDPGFLFWSSAHRRAYAILEYGILTRAPITLVTGEVGAGKTTLILQLLRRIGAEVSVGLVSNAQGARGDLLRWVLMALNQPAPQGADYVALFAAFQRHVIDEYAAGRRVVLIFDEAQNLGRDVLEELRMLTNINANGDELLQLILVGQPELRDIVHRPDMAQFTQRVAARFHLPAMDAATVHNYIEHRLSVAGAPYMLFDEGAVARIFRASGGVPRLVNQLCDLSLVYAYTEDAAVVTAATVAHVIDDGVFVGGPDPDAADHTPRGAQTQRSEAGNDG